LNTKQSKVDSSKVFPLRAWWSVSLLVGVGFIDLADRGLDTSIPEKI